MRARSLARAVVIGVALVAHAAAGALTFQTIQDPNFVGMAPGPDAFIHTADDTAD
jgi:hypothetical protein